MTTLIMRMTAVDEAAAEEFAISYLRTHRETALTLIAELQKQTNRFSTMAQFQLFQIKQQVESGSYADISTIELDREIGQNFGLWLFSNVQKRNQDRAFAAATACSTEQWNNDVAIMVAEHEQRCVEIRKNFEVQAQRMADESAKRWADTSARMEREYHEAVAKMRAGR